MSLRIRLSLIVSMLFLAGMLLGLSFLITSARKRVVEEVDAAASLTRQLLTSVLSADAAPGAVRDDQARLLERLLAIEDVRHLDIRIIGPGQAALPAMEVPDTDSAPAWFVYLVQSTPREYVVPLDSGGAAAILIRTNPADEIAEVWLETRTFMLVLLLVLLILNGFVYVTLGRWLAPVSAIVTGLTDAEHGNFSGHISQASLPEMKLIADKLNQLTAVLRASKADNERLSRRSLQIQEEERKLLARELHDEMGQSISAIKAIAFSIAERTAGADAMSEEGARRIGAISSQIGGHVRSMMTRLRPAVLDELGLVAALQVMVDEWNRDHRDTFCSFRTEGDCSGFSADMQIGIYRIIQEALTNVARHADADRVDIQLTARDHCRLEIVDNGCGYEQHSVPAGMGLTGIRERCQAHNASFKLTTSPGMGVRIAISFPATNTGDT
jgi:two-component system sensor histidine kinase UhpB